MNFWQVGTCTAYQLFASMGAPSWPTKRRFPRQQLANIEVNPWPQSTANSCRRLLHTLAIHCNKPLYNGTINSCIEQQKSLVIEQNIRLAHALESLKALQEQGVKAIHGNQLSRIDREALIRAGFLKPVIRGWYVPSRPDEAKGETTAWYASMREFVASYADARFHDQWHVNPEQSLILRSGDRTIPKQIQIWALKGTNQTVPLPHNCSLFIYKAPKLLAAEPSADCGALRLVDLPAALVAASPTLFQQSPIAAQIALASLPDASGVLRSLLEGPHPSVAARLAGGFSAIGRKAIADEIVGAMRSAGYGINETNPFEKPVLPALPGGRAESPYVQRLRLMWAEMRERVLGAFPAPPHPVPDPEALIKDVEARYVTDAYHSLSIEGYRVSATLVEKVRAGSWNPDGNEKDRDMRDAMAARGYFEAHNVVKKDLLRVIRGENAGTVFREGLPKWYQALFSPSVQAGILKPVDLAGYRNDQVFIRGASHVPLSKEAVRECMPILFELLEQEREPAVRAVLGHFLFVYIHPYMDGNGRLGRFLMNLMLASSGFVWTVIPVERRAQYMAALEQASSFGNIDPFARFIAELCVAQLLAPLPRPG
jgi:Fic/DOC family protein